MKMYALLLVTFGLALTALSQGTVDFRNGGITFPTVADRLIYFDRPGGTKVVGTNYGAALWYVPGTSGEALWNFTGGRQAGDPFPFRVPTTSLPGTWLVPLGRSSLLTLEGVPIGATATLQVRAWEFARYPTFLDAFRAGAFGVSGSFLYTVPEAGSTPDKYYMDNFRAWAAIPEPSVLGLGALGLVGLLWWRRR
jgi:hypothetical protein